jgi:4-alpha-glucanotransferase
MKERLFCYLGRRISSNNIHDKLIELLMSSVANLVVIPVQDILGLGPQARMNHPGKTQGNWQWRLRPGQLTSQQASKLAALTSKYGRS